MTRHRIDVDLHGDHVHLDLAHLPRDARPVVAAAMVHHLGLDLHDLAKAGGGGEGPDPRFPELEKLIEEMRVRWTRWTSWLVDQLAVAMVRKRATPPVVAGLLEVHATGVTAATTGAMLGPSSEPLVVDPSLISPTPEIHAPIAVAFRLGLEVDPATPPEVPDAPRMPLRPLNQRDQAAIAYARTKAAIYVRKPIAAVHATAQRILLDDGIRLDPRALTEEDRGQVGAIVASAIEHREGATKTAERLREACSDATITANFDRIAITEIAAAHGAGAYAALLATVPPGDDPLVYKIVSPSACADCLRIWGHPANPVIYKLSTVVAHTNAGGNFRLPRKDWAATIGPIHPRCLCPPVIRWNPEVHDAVTDAASDLRKIFG